MSLDNSKTIKSSAFRGFIVLTVFLAVSLISPFTSTASAFQQSYTDINGDSITDAKDLMVLFAHWIEKDCDMYPGWCGYADVDRSGRVNFVDFAIIVGNWKDRSLSVSNSIKSPVRLALGPADNVYVTDAQVGSVFVYTSKLKAIAELRKLKKPLGIAVDDSGNMYVGCDGTDTVEVYDPNGVNIMNIGACSLKMPNDLAFDDDGNLYVVDSLDDSVKVFDKDGKKIRSFDNGDLRFPSTIEIAYLNGTGEVYIGDQGHHQIKVFDFDGNLLRSFGSIVSSGMMGFGWKLNGKFMNIQSLAMDEHGRLHVLDSYMKNVQILNPDTGAFIESYAEGGTGPGQIGLGQDIAISKDNKVIVTDAHNKRIEVIYTVPETIP